MSIMLCCELLIDSAGDAQVKFRFINVRLSYIRLGPWYLPGVMQGHFMGKTDILFQVELSGKGVTLWWRSFVEWRPLAWRGRHVVLAERIVSCME